MESSKVTIKKKKYLLYQTSHKVLDKNPEQL